MGRRSWILHRLVDQPAGRILQLTFGLYPRYRNSDRNWRQRLAFDHMKQAHMKRSPPPFLGRTIRLKLGQYKGHCFCRCV
jgi:hypothetical protein